MPRGDSLPTQQDTDYNESDLEEGYYAPPPVDADDDEKARYAIWRFICQNPHYNGLYRQWAKPIFFLVGKQWLLWNNRQNTYLLDTDVPEWRQQPVTNFTYAVYRTAMAKLTKQKPTLEVIPPSGDSEDRDAAELGQALLEFLWRYLKHPQKVARALGWLLATGNVAFKVDWDSDAGDVKPRTALVEVDDPDNPGETKDVPCACDEDGEPYRREPLHADDKAPDGGAPYDMDREPEEEAEGDIVFDVVDPMCYRYNPEATSPEDATEMYVARLQPRQQVANEYGIDVNDLMSAAGEEGDERSQFDEMLSSVTAGPPDPFLNKWESTGASLKDALADRVLVLEYYHRQNASLGFPEGRHWITAGGKKVWPPEGDAEYPNGEAELPHGFWPPLVVLVDTPIPGQAQGLGLLGQVVPLNEQLNFLDGKIGEYHTTMAMGGVIWVAPSDRGIQITSEPGQVKVSKAYGENGRHPIREKLEALPGPVYNERNVISEKLRTVAGLGQLDMGQRPEGVTAGRAFLVLQEASDAAYMPTLMAIEEALCEVGRRELVVAKEHYTSKRTIKIAGSKGQWQFRSFVGADLRDGLDVRVQVGSMFPWAKSAQWDTKLSVIQALPQLVVNPKTGEVDKEALAKYLDAGASGLSTFESEEDPDLVEIDREHAMFEAYDPTAADSSNQLPQLAFWQNQTVHQKYHFEFLKRDYGRFSRWSPAAQEAFIEHCRLTTEAVDQLAASLMPPGPTPPGEPTDQEPGGPAGPGGAPAAPAAGGGKQSLSLVPPGGSAGRENVPTASHKQSQLRLTRADRAAAGQ